MLTVRTFPIMTESTASGGTFAAVRAAFAATVWSSVKEEFANFPPYVPKGVRLVPTMKTPLI